MIRVRAWATALACVVAIVAAGPALAGPVSDQLKETIDRVVKILEDPALKGPDRAAERRADVTKIAQEIFDFPEVARRSLARHWQPLTDKQREEFTALFADLLERSYVSKIELYSGEKITYAQRAHRRRYRHGAHPHRDQERRRGSDRLPNAQEGTPVAGLRRQYRGREPRLQLPHAVQQDHPDLLVQRPHPEAQDEAGGARRESRPRPRSRRRRSGRRRCAQRRSAGDPGGEDTRCDARNPAAIHTISRSRRTSE